MHDEAPTECRGGLRAFVSSASPAHAPSQAHRRLQEGKQLAQAQPALQAELTQLDAVAEALAQQQQAAGQTLENVQVHLRAQHAAHAHACCTGCSHP